MITFEFDKVEEAVSTFKTRLKPGIHAVEVVSVEEVEAAEKKDGTMGSPYVLVKFTNTEGEHEEKFFMSEKAAPTSKGKLKHLFLAVLSGDQNSLTRMTNVEQTNRITVGKKVWIKLRGEETVMQDGSKTFIKASLAWSPFAESYVQGEAPAILKFSEAADVKMLSAAQKPQVAAPALVGGDSLPF